MPAPSADAATAVILMDLAVIVTVGSLLARLAVRWGQPPVVGEIVAGLLLGPSLLGVLPGHLTDALFPQAERPFLGVLANVGLVLFMFAVGYEVDVHQMRQTRSTALVVAAGSVAVPLALGIGTGFLLYPMHRTAGSHDVGELSFVLFLGVAMSITAFPVLARILTDLGLHRSKLGSFSMACAAAIDAAAWGLLAVVVLLAGGGSWPRMGWRIAGMLLFVVVLVFVVRPLLSVLLQSGAMRRSLGQGPLAVILVGLLLSAWVTAKLGFHPVFGAFAFGVATPRAAMSATAPEAPLLIDRTGQLLVPIFFVTTGLTANIAGIGRSGLFQALLVLTAACVGKFVGAAGAARMRGMESRRAMAIGVLMNSRGLTELVVIQTGVSVGAIDARVATILVIMAVVTTVMTTPLFRRVYGERQQREDEAIRAAGVPAPATVGE